MRRPTSRVWLAALGFSWGLAAVWVGSGETLSARAAPDLLTGWSLMAAGLIAMARRPSSGSGNLLLLAGFAWFLGNFAGSGGTFAAIAGAGILVHRGVIVHALLTFPTGRVHSRAAGVVVLLGYAASFAVPAWTTPYGAVAFAVGIVVAVSAVRAPVRFRRSRRIASLAAWVFGLAIVVGPVARTLAPTPAVTTFILVGYEVAVVVVAGLLVGGLLSTGRDHHVADLVIELGATPGQTLESALSWALGDPTLRIHEPGAGGTGGVDAALAPSARTVVRGLDGRPAAVLEHAADALADPTLKGAATSAVLLEIENRRLRDEVEAQASEVQASQRRLLRAADEEGRRLESRIQAGAAAHLSRIGDLLDEAESHSPGSESLVAQLRGILDETRAELSRIAAGLYPRSLEVAGLSGALVSAVSGSTIPINVDVQCGMIEPELTLAAYYCALEAISNVIKHSGAARASVIVRGTEDWLTIEVRDDGVGGARPDQGTGLHGVADRVGVLGGRFTVTDQDGTVVKAELPRSRASA